MEKNNYTKITRAFAMALLIFSFMISPVFSAEDMISISACEGLFAGGGNADDNLMASIVGLCLPGILKNLDRLEQNECEKILCEYEAAQNGVSPLLCAKKSAYNTCMITGEGYDIIEGLIIGNLRQNIVTILENPLALGAQVAKTAIEQAATCPSGPGSCSTPFSKSAAILLAVFEVGNAIMTLQTLFNQLSVLAESGKTSCEQLEDIRDELEQIIEEYEIAQYNQNQAIYNEVDNLEDRRFENDSFEQTFTENSQNNDFTDEDDSFGNDTGLVEEEE